MKKDEFSALILETALVRGEVSVASAPNGSVWFVNAKTKEILLGLV